MLFEETVSSAALDLKSKSIKIDLTAFEGRCSLRCCIKISPWAGIDREGDLDSNVGHDFICKRLHICQF